MVRRPDIARTVFQLDPSLRIEDLMVRVKGANSDIYIDILSRPPKVWGAEI
jgi:hypothetical protein